MLRSCCRSPVSCFPAEGAVASASPFGKINGGLERDTATMATSRISLEQIQHPLPPVYERNYGVGCVPSKPMAKFLLTPLVSRNEKAVIHARRSIGHFRFKSDMRRCSGLAPSCTPIIDAQSRYDRLPVGHRPWGKGTRGRGLWGFSRTGCARLHGGRGWSTCSDCGRPPDGGNADIADVGPSTSNDRFGIRIAMTLGSSGWQFIEPRQRWIEVVPR